jgi:hypothetical protein
VTMVIPDKHIPFEHRDALPFLRAVKKKYRPTDFINLGDMEDWHGINMHEHDPDGFSAGHELEELRRKIKPYFKLFPRLKICTSNHGSLPYRQAFKCGLPKELIKSYREILLAPRGWVWADSWEIDGVIYEHGDPGTGRNAAINAAHANMQSTVIGHVHSFAGIQYSANSKHLIFGFNVGCLIDKDKYAFAYGKKFKAKPILGCGVVIDGIPTFIPMLLNRKGRWTGKLV